MVILSFNNTPPPWSIGCEGKKKSKRQKLESNYQKINFSAQMCIYNIKTAHTAKHSVRSGASNVHQ